MVRPLVDLFNSQIIINSKMANTVVNDSAGDSTAALINLSTPFSSAL